MKYLENFNVNYITGVVGIIVMFAIAINGAVTYNMKQNELFAANLDKAMEKGIDPIAVKCAYDNAKPELCTTYVMRMKQ